MPEISWVSAVYLFSCLWPYSVGPVHLFSDETTTEILQPMGGLGREHVTWCFITESLCLVMLC